MVAAVRILLVEDEGLIRLVTQSFTDNGENAKSSYKGSVYPVHASSCDLLAWQRHRPEAALGHDLLALRRQDGQR